jgi:DNA-binding transcriptional ArsR family regulator
VKTYEEPMNALGDPTRRRNFERLAAGPKAVGELARGLPVSRPAVSQHLRVLKTAGLVSERPEGTRRVYRVDPGGIVALRAYFEDFWDRALADFQTEAEARERSKR